MMNVGFIQYESSYGLSVKPSMQLQQLSKSTNINHHQQYIHDGMQELVQTKYRYENNVRRVRKIAITRAYAIRSSIPVLLKQYW